MSSESKNVNTRSKTITAEQLVSYPVLLREYDPNWAVIFEEEKEKLWQTAGDSIEGIFHFDSTSVPGMLAKPEFVEKYTRLAEEKSGNSENGEV